MNNQQTLFDLPQKPLPFGGVTYEPEKDEKRLTGQLHRVFEAMKSGEWFTLERLQSIVGGSQAGISARIRDLRKPAFGGYQVDRKRVKDSGLFMYRLTI